jgi:lipopolysaccharide export system protein LptA
VITTINKIVLICILFLLPLSALAATEIASKDRGPVEVTADRLEVDDQAQTLVFVGNAVATQDDVTIHGKRLTVKYTGEKREIVQVLAEGAVRIQQGTRVATGERAVLYHQEERIVLTGSPEIRDGDSFVKGQEITVYMNDRRSVVTGGAGGRVNAVFTPKKEGKP